MNPSAALVVRVELVSVPRWCEGPLTVGLQRGRSGLVLGTPFEDGVRFEVTVRVSPGQDGLPDFGGPVVQGRPGERFLYLSWGAPRGGSIEMFRRLKLYLGPLKRAAWEQPGISWADVAAGAVGVRIEGTGDDGTPRCGTAEARWRAEPAVG